jgi:hypothetical protein
MHSDGKLPTEAQRKKLCEMLFYALLEMRVRGSEGKAQQASDLAHAFHNLPLGMWHNDFSLSFFRESFLVPYEEKYPEKRVLNYVATLDEIISMKD